MSVQHIIRKRRLELGLTLKQVAKALNVAEGTVSRYESGDIQNMGIDKIEALSKVLRCSPGYLMGWEDLQSSSVAEKDKLIDLFNSLNDEGQKKLIERGKELLLLGFGK